MIRRLLIAILLSAVVTGLVWLYWINVVDPPGHFQHPPLTPAERKMVEEAVRYHGRYLIVREGNKFTMIRDGKEIRL